MIDTNVIYNEDCLIGMEKLGDKSVDLILTDLPYGVTAAKWDKYIDINKLWQHFERIITDKGVILMFGQEPFSSKLRLSNLDLYRYDIVWKKQKPSNFQLMNFQMGRVTENICVFSKAKACYTKNGIAMTYNPQLVKRDKSRLDNLNLEENGSWPNIRITPLSVIILSKCCHNLLISIILSHFAAVIP